jgi:hypothetical protein
MWQVYTRLTSASDFLLSIFRFYVALPSRRCKKNGIDASSAVSCARKLKFWLSEFWANLVHLILRILKFRLSPFPVGNYMGGYAKDTKVEHGVKCPMFHKAPLPPMQFCFRTPIYCR